LDIELKGKSPQRPHAAHNDTTTSSSASVSVSAWVGVQSSQCLQNITYWGTVQRVPGEPPGAKDADQLVLEQ
jgi:hypothetical protein